MTKREKIEEQKDVNFVVLTFNCNSVGEEVPKCKLSSHSSVP